MLEKEAIVSVPIDDLISRRWSCRAFNPDVKVSREQIISICEAGRWAPSCFGDEPWRFIVWDKNHDPESYNKGFSCLGEWNQAWAKNAPILLAAFADNKFRKNNAPNRWAEFDTGACCENIYLQAVSLGLMAHCMGGFDRIKLQYEFNVPDNFTPMAMIAIGAQDEPSSLDEMYLKAELSARSRRPIGETFYDSCWEKAVV